MRNTTRYLIGVVAWSVLSLGTGGVDVSAQSRLVDQPEPVEPLEHTEDDHRLGAEDVVAVAVLQAPEMNATVRVAAGGQISLPLVGAVEAAGLTAYELEERLETILRDRYIRHPDVTVRVTEVNSRPVTVGGAVRRPGVFQVRQSATLLNVLSLAGGVSDDAGDVVLIRRGGAGAEAPVEEVPLRPLLDEPAAAANVRLGPGDIVTVTRAATVYVLGAVKKPGAFSLRSHDRLTVLRALALVEGPTPTASTGDLVLIRTSDDGERAETTFDLSAIVKGKAPDLAMQPRDILFVPQSGGKAAARATLDALTRIVTLRTAAIP